VKGHGEDTICWKPSPQMGFRVSSYYRTLAPAGDFIPLEKHLEAKSTFKGFFLFMGCFFGENFYSRKFAKKKKKNIILVSWCCLCKGDGQSVDHLLLHCPFSREIWDMVLALFWV
jgi:hypothetical protein